MGVKIDWNGLSEGFGDVLAEELDGVLEGAKADLKAFGREIARDLVEATSAGDAQWEAQLLDQARVVAETNRIRANAAAWATAIKVIGAVAKGVGVGLAGALAL